MPVIQASDGIELFVKDWGHGRPLVFVHSSAVTNEIWQYQHACFVRAGYRVIAFDRRGHGRSDQPGAGYDLDTLADDLARVMAARDVHGATLIGHSMGCAEIVRYLTRHGAERVAQIVLAATTTPLLRKTADNPDGIDNAVFEALRAGWLHDYPRWVVDNAAPFFVPETSQAMIQWGIAQMLPIPVHVAVECNKTVVESDTRAELAAIHIPALVVHGTHDASAPIALTGARTAQLLPHCRYQIYDGAPHGLLITHLDRLNADIAAFLASYTRTY